MIEYQEKMVPKGAYYMQYGRKPGEDQGNWYVADCSSIAMGVLATAVRSKEPAERQRYLTSVVSAADEELRYISGLLAKAPASNQRDQLALFALMSMAEKLSPGAIYRATRR
ncbi:MAG: hypothetical protein NTW96_26925 [Planctomycetia bacterium]|nr:hypothetical protein [Planctomycetia bacterium]